MPSNSLTDQQIAEAEAVCEKASPGPWIIDKTVKITDEDRNFIAEVRGVKISSPPAAIACKDDAAFIAASRTGWPLALSALRAARKLAKERQAVSGKPMLTRAGREKLGQMAGVTIPPDNREMEDALDRLTRAGYGALNSGKIPEPFRADLESALQIAMYNLGAGPAPKPPAPRMDPGRAGQAAEGGLSPADQGMAAAAAEDAARRLDPLHAEPADPEAAARALSEAERETRGGAWGHGDPDAEDDQGEGGAR